MDKNVRKTFLKVFSAVAALGLLVVATPKTFSVVKAQSEGEFSQESDFKIDSLSESLSGKPTSKLSTRNLLGGYVTKDYDSEKGSVQASDNWAFTDETVFFRVTPKANYGVKQIKVYKIYDDGSYHEMEFTASRDDINKQYKEYYFTMVFHDVVIDVDFELLDIVVSDAQGAENSFVYGEGGTASYTVQELNYLYDLDSYTVSWYSDSTCETSITPEITTTVNTHESLEFTVSETCGAGDYYFTASSAGTTSNTTKLHIEKADQDAPVGVSSVPITKVDGVDGKITGVSSAMEYSSDETNWISISGEEVGSLAAGTYYVRYAENDNYFASPSVTVEVLTRYAVTFDMQGHGTQVPQQDVVDELYATKPSEDPSEEAWLFKGWYNEASCDTEFDFEGTKIEEPTVVYAKWIEDLKAKHFTFAEPEDLVYDGQAKVAKVTTELDTGEITLKYYDESGSVVTPINVGTYTVKIDVAANEIYPEHTEIEDESWTFSIVPANTMTISIDNYSGVYDAKIHSSTASSNVTEGTTFEYSTDDGETWSTEAPTILNVGTVNAKARAVNPNYETVSKDFTLEVTRKDCTITVDNQTKEYGEEDPEFTVTIEGRIYNSEKLNYSIFRQAGENVGTRKLSIVTAEEQGNYKVTGVDGVLTITKSTALTVSCEGYSGVYDGQAHKVTSSTNITTGVTVEYSTDNGITWSREAPSITNVGKTEVTVRATSDKYETATSVCTLEVTAKEVTIAAKDNEKVYGEEDPEFKADVTGLLGSDSVSYTLTRDSGEACGTYAIKVNAEETQGNYHVTKQNGTFTISNASDIKFIAEDLTAKYDGKAHTLTVDTNVRNNTTVSYSTDNETWSQDAPSFTDAGTYKVYVKAENPNYDTITGSYKVTIEKRNIVITTDSGVWTFTGATLSKSHYEVTGDGFIGTDGLVFGETSTITKVGQIDNNIEYSAKAGTNLNNYNITVVKGKLIVNATEPMDATENINENNVKKSDKEQLDLARQDFERLSNAPDLTTNESKDVEEDLNRINKALKVLEDVENVENLINNLPSKDKLSLDDEQKFNDALNKYNELSEHGKELVDGDLQTKIKDLEKQLKELKGYQPQIIDGGEQTIDITKSKENAQFRSDAPIDEFIKVLVDDKEVDRSNYNVEEGSTIVELRNSFLQGLEAGTHTLSIVSTSGTATTTFVIAQSVPAGVFVGFGVGAVVLVAIIVVVVVTLKKQGKKPQTEGKQPEKKTAEKQEKKPTEKK